VDRRQSMGWPKLIPLACQRHFHRQTTAYSSRWIPAASPHSQKNVNWGLRRRLEGVPAPPSRSAPRLFVFALQPVDGGTSPFPSSWVSAWRLISGSAESLPRPRWRHGGQERLRFLREAPPRQGTRSTAPHANPSGESLQADPSSSPAIRQRGCIRGLHPHPQALDKEGGPGERGFVLAVLILLRLTPRDFLAGARGGGSSRPTTSPAQTSSSLRLQSNARRRRRVSSSAESLKWGAGGEPSEGLVRGGELPTRSLQCSLGRSGGNRIG